MSDDDQIGTGFEAQEPPFMALDFSVPAVNSPLVNTTADAAGGIVYHYRHPDRVQVTRQGVGGYICDLRFEVGLQRVGNTVNCTVDIYVEVGPNSLAKAVRAVGTKKTKYAWAESTLLDAAGNPLPDLDAVHNMHFSVPIRTKLVQLGAGEVVSTEIASRAVGFDVATARAVYTEIPPWTKFAVYL